MPLEKSNPTRLKTAFWLDTGLLITVCAMEQIQFTGALVHEWPGLTLAVLMVWHLLLSWQWIARHSRRFFPVASLRTLVNYVLNLSLFALVVAVIFTGIMISQEAIPAFTHVRTGIPQDSSWFWIHNHASDFVVIFAGLHLAINWDWCLAAARKLFGRTKARTA